MSKAKAAAVKQHQQKQKDNHQSEREVELDESVDVYCDSQDESEYEPDTHEKPREVPLKEKEVTLGANDYLKGRKPYVEPEKPTKKRKYVESNDSDSEFEKKPKKNNRLKQRMYVLEVRVVELIENDIDNSYNYKNNSSIEHILIESIVGYVISVKQNNVSVFAECVE
jgi:hypothetical protein